MRFLKYFIVLLFILPFTSSAKETIKIGFAFPMSGNLAYAGEDLRNGLKMAQEELSKDARFNYELIYEDTRSENSGAITAAQKLININKVDVIVSLWANNANIIAPMAEKAGILHFSIQFDSTLPKRFKNTLMIETPVEDYTELLVEISKENKAKSVGILMINDTIMQLQKRFLDQALTRAGIKTVSLAVCQPKENNFRSVLAKLENKNPDVYILLADFPESELILKQLKERNNQKPIAAFLETLQDLKLGEGVSYPANGFSSSTFQENFKKKFGHPYVIRAPHAYDLLRILVKAAESSDQKPNTEKLYASILGLKSYEGAFDNIEFRQDGVIRIPASKFKIEGGKRVFLNSLK
jgi:branched-chain amino acid transport system substrate-binding protein